MAAPGDEDRNEPASRHKLDEARRKGQVAKSAELNSAVALLIGWGVAMVFGSWIAVGCLQLMRRLLAGAHDWIFDVPQLSARLGVVGHQAIHLLSPLLALAAGGALLSNLVQTGPVFAPGQLAPDFSRLNPAAGLRRIFSVRTLFEAGKSLVKLAAYVGIAWIALDSLAGSLEALYQRAPQSYPQLFRHHLIRLLGCLVLGVCAVAAVDLLFSRWEYARRMRMSRREVKDEQRRHHGDPLIRRRRQERLRDLRRRSGGAARVRDADVLVTNPQHVAVALRYRRGKDRAPQVLAKGAGHRAGELRTLATRHRVPIAPNPPLARALFRGVALDAEIPEKHYAVVAELLHWARRCRETTATEAG